MRAGSKKAASDPRGGHVRLHWDLLDSLAWQALSWAEQGLYIAMRRKLLGSNNGNIEATLGTLKHAGITSSASLAKGLRALITVGLIDKTRQGGIAHGVKVCSLYRFTDEPVFDHLKQGVRAQRASHDWRKFGKLVEVRAALKAAHTAAKRPGNELDPKLQNLKRIGSVSELKATRIGSIPEAVGVSLVQNLKQSQACQTGPQPA